MIIRANNIIKTFNHHSLPVTALAGVSLSVEKGAFVALCGPSGSGKTTLLNLLGCLDRPSQGQIYLEDEELTALSQKQLSGFRLYKVGFIFQDYNLIPTFRVRENIEYVLWLQGVGARERRDRAEQVCERFGIGKLLQRYPAQLSRGQQQRVAVARAIVHKPLLVLGDELTANLDHQTGCELMDFLHELNKEIGMTFVYATHDPAMMERADRVMRMVDGRLQADCS